MNETFIKSIIFIFSYKIKLIFNFFKIINFLLLCIIFYFIINYIIL